MAAQTTGGVKEKKKQPLYVKIFIALFAGIIFGYILNFMGGVENPVINEYILPFLQFLGDFFIKLIKMIVVPLVSSVLLMRRFRWGHQKLRSIGVKTILWFLFSSGIAATIGLVLANIIQPGKGLILGTIENTVEVKSFPVFTRQSWTFFQAIRSHP